MNDESMTFDEMKFTESELASMTLGDAEQWLTHNDHENQEWYQRGGLLLDETDDDYFARIYNIRRVRQRIIEIGDSQPAWQEAGF